MRPSSKLLTILFALMVGLPPHWCQGFSDLPVACCPACADADCHEDSEPQRPTDPPKQECQCGNLPIKQAETVAIESTAVPAGFVLSGNDTFVGYVYIVEIFSQRNLQQAFCCWRK
ncbi:hypothetical protein ETAA8_08840 [Anatilimnocola aggregata]|uniref:Secreted protein n=1 Tax=Anatilimnocola aggregata TaxID=2528021 RepID=A0A517Y6P8_9BACT|nr:hypothetical protein ETAA8_08840 [Anatilimnocola aggregata]